MERLTAYDWPGNIRELRNVLKRIMILEDKPRIELDDLPRSATAHVLEDSSLLSLEKGQLKRLIVHYPELALGMLKGLSLRLRDTNLK